MLTLRLSLVDANNHRLRALTRRLENMEVTVSALDQEQATNSEALPQAYFCHNECRKQQPPVELRQEPIPFDKWLPQSPEIYFLARHQEKYVGVCLFERDARNFSLLESGFTGVLPAWTGKGVATALKAYGLLSVKRQGYQIVETNNLMVNRGMCAVNTSLGFCVVRKRLITYPIPSAQGHSFIPAEKYLSPKSRPS